jgi:hypothetical protein
MPSRDPSERFVRGSNKGEKEFEPQISQMTQIFLGWVSAEYVLGRMCRFKACHVRKRNRRPPRGRRLLLKIPPYAPQPASGSATRCDECVRPSQSSARTPTPKICVICEICGLIAFSSHGRNLFCNRPVARVGWLEFDRAPDGFLRFLLFLELAIGQCQVAPAGRRIWKNLH